MTIAWTVVEFVDSLDFMKGIKDSALKLIISLPPYYLWQVL